MRGAESYGESLSSTVRLEEFVPADHPLRKIRLWVNDALSSMDARFSAMYKADIKGGRSSIAPETLMRAMLLQALYSERELVEQFNYILPFRLFVGLSIDDTVWNHSVFSKHRDRLIEHEAVTGLFNAAIEMSQARRLLSGKHFSGAGPLVQAWANHKSVRRKGGTDDDRPPGSSHSEPRSYGTRQSTTDPDAWLYRKSHVAPALLSFLGEALVISRHKQASAFPA